MATTIPRNHKKKIAAIRAAVTRAIIRDLSNDFAGVEVPVASAWDELAEYDFARLTDRGEGKYVITIHGNRWFELS